MSEAKPAKVSYIGAPAVFLLELFCKPISEAFGGYGLYRVGSSLERADWRDVDLRLILPDDEFMQLFPDAHMNGGWELDQRWLVMTTSISYMLTKQTGLPIDFQFQPATFANKHHKKRRDAVGMRMEPRPAPQHGGSDQGGAT